MALLPDSVGRFQAKLNAMIQSWPEIVGTDLAYYAVDDERVEIIVSFRGERRPLAIRIEEIPDD